MEIKTASIEELETRKAQIGVDADAEGADLDALDKEIREINAEIETRKAEEAQRVEIRKLVAAGLGKGEKVVDAAKQPEDVRSSKAYVDAYARYIARNDATECRSLLMTENVDGGTIPVPALVDEIVRTAWDNDQIMSRVRRTTIRGNLKVPFEISADPAYVHTEGTAAITDEDLTLGMVTLIAESVKKYVRLTDETIAMGGEALIRYVYDELTYQIVKEVTKNLLNDIATATTSGSSSKPAVAAITEAPDVTTVANAFAHLSDSARDIVVIMHRLTSAVFKAAAKAANFAMDPFEGFTVLYDNSLPAYNTANEGDVYMIVGDLRGAHANYPEGDGIAIKYDDTTEMAADVVRILGRQYVAAKLVAPGCFCNVKKPSSAVTT